MVYPNYQNYYPQQPIQQPMMQQPVVQQPVVQQPQQQQNQPIQNGGYVIVQSDEEIRRYPVAHGNSVTFRIENQPILVEKSLGYSQFDTPHYERYKLIKEDMPIPEEKKDDYLLKTDYKMDYESLKEQIDRINKTLNSVQAQMESFDKKTTTRKKEVTNE